MEQVVNEPSLDYTAKLAALRTLRTAFHEELAAAFDPVLNQYVRSEPQHTAEDCSDLASLINEHARLLGLSLRCPRSGRPATLVVDREGKGSDPDLPRWRLQITDDRGRRQRHLNSRSLPDLELMPAPPRIEGQSRVERLRKHDGGRSR